MSQKRKLPAAYADDKPRQQHSSSVSSAVSSPPVSSFSSSSSSYSSAATAAARLSGKRYCRGIAAQSIQGSILSGESTSASSQTSRVHRPNRRTMSKNRYDLFIQLAINSVQFDFRGSRFPTPPPLLPVAQNADLIICNFMPDFRVNKKKFLVEVRI